MYQGRLWLFCGNKRRRIILIYIIVLALFNTNKLFSQKVIDEKIALTNIGKISIENLKENFNPAKNTFKNSKIKTIIIDPGHGGKDPGSIGFNKIKEKDIVLTFSLDLEKELKKIIPNVKIVLTRNGDTYPTLQERYKIANDAAKINSGSPENALFISVHANASLNTSAKGFEAYFLTSQESSEYAKAVSMYENSSLVKFDKTPLQSYDKASTQISHNYLLIEQYQKESRMLSESIVNEVYKVEGVYKRSRPVHNALFYVLKGAIMPATLIEIGFITNEKDATFLSNEKNRLKMVKAVALGVQEYFKKYDDSNGFLD